MVKKERVAVISDIHIPYQDNDAVELMKAYVKDYKPDHFVINGDLLDFYSLSTFDKSPDRKHSVAEEINDGVQFLKEMRQIVGKDCKMYFTEGNHEQRLQRYMFRNPELSDLPDLRLDKLLKLKEQNIAFSGVDGDYWGTDTGHVQLGEVLVLHGDNRLNGAATSAQAGYSATNTMRKMQHSVVMGHVHRQAVVAHSTPYRKMTGVESGCLCVIPGTANWQQGFTTFELHDGKMRNVNNVEIVDKQIFYEGGSYILQ